MNRKGLGPNQQKILDLLKAYPKSTVTEIAQLLFPTEKITRGGKRYNSVCRSIHLLETRGLIEKEGGQAKWKTTEEKPT